MYDLCILVLQENVDSIDECGGLSYDILEPILLRAKPLTLMNIEDHNEYLLEDTGMIETNLIPYVFEIRFKFSFFAALTIINDQFQCKSGKSIVEKSFRRKKEKSKNAKVGVKCMNDVVKKRQINLID